MNGLDSVFAPAWAILTLLGGAIYWWGFSIYVEVRTAQGVHFRPGVPQLVVAAAMLISVIVSAVVGFAGAALSGRLGIELSWSASTSLLLCLYCGYLTYRSIVRGRQFWQSIP